MQITSSNDLVFKRLGSIFRREQVLYDINIITTEEFNPQEIEPSIKKLQAFELDEFKELLGLVNVVTAPGFDGEVRIRAVPSHQDIQSADINIIDTFQYNSTAQQIILKLTNNTFQSIPNIATSKGDVKIRKISESKKGHGSAKFVSFNYCIIIPISKEHPISSEIGYAIKSIFSNSTLKVFTSDAEKIEYLSQARQYSNTVVEEVLATNINQSALFDAVGSTEHSQPIYEYLMLVHMNSPQLIQNVDDYISSYRIPEHLSKKSPIVRKLKMFRLQLMNLTIFNLISKHCVSISCYSENSHILTMRSLQDNELFLWECQ